MRARRTATETIGEVTTDEFVRVMITNALAPMRVIETLQDLVTDDGLIGAMSSGQGSVANNVSGMREVYRGSKAALNQFMRSFAVRQADTRRAMVLMAPGWVRTELGGPDARLTIEESVPSLVDVLIAKRGRPGPSISTIWGGRCRGDRELTPEGAAATSGFIVPGNYRYSCERNYNRCVAQPDALDMPASVAVNCPGRSR